MAKILVAAAPEPRAAVERVLAGHQLSFAATVGEAQRLLEGQSFELIICTLAFDESRMYDLVRLVMSNAAWRKIPFVCARVRRELLVSPEAREAIASTCRVLGAAAFLDIAEFKKEPEGEMRRAIERLLPEADAQAPQPSGTGG